jgi:hypothetical protein
MPRLNTLILLLPLFSFTHITMVDVSGLPEVFFLGDKRLQLAPANLKRGHAELET